MPAPRSSFLFSRRGLAAMVAILALTTVWAWQRAPETLSVAKPLQADRAVASVGRRHQMPFASDRAAEPVTTESIKRLTGIDAIRGRAALFFPDSMLNHVGSFSLRMNLFPDLVLGALFQAPSVAETNSNLFVGTIEGDPEGEFRLFVDGSKITGTIRAFKKTYQIVPLGDQAHLIVEVRMP